MIAALAISVPASAGDIDPAAIQLWDVIYTADGGVLKGVIVEEVPGVSVRISIVGGTSIVVQLPNVTRFTKELNPMYAGAPAAASGAGGRAAPTRLATTGLRLSASPGLAYHFEEEISTFLISLHAGWELAYGEWGLIPGVFFDYVADVGVYGDGGVALTPGVTAAYRGSTISPFVGFGLGLDLVNGDEVTLATSMSLGVQLLVSRSIALTAQGRFNRGSAGDYTDTLSYLGFTMGIEYRR